MKLDKAIEILTLVDTWPQEVNKDDLGDAILLGKEALKRVKYNRSDPDWPDLTNLPGETPENYHPNTVSILKRLKESPLGTKPRP